GRDKPRPSPAGTTQSRPVPSVPPVFRESRETIQPPVWGRVSDPSRPSKARQFLGGVPASAVPPKRFLSTPRASAALARISRARAIQQLLGARRFILR